MDDGMDEEWCDGIVDSSTASRVWTLHRLASRRVESELAIDSCVDESILRLVETLYLHIMQKIFLPSLLSLILLKFFDNLKLAV